MTTMTDRELLELAALAAGYPTPDFSNTQWGKPWIFDVGYWSSLASYGDALRLAVKLEMIVDNYGGQVRVRNGWSYGSPTFYTEDIVGDDPAAICRAITRAAAEIGKAMKEGHA